MPESELKARFNRERRSRFNSVGRVPERRLACRSRVLRPLCSSIGIVPESRGTVHARSDAWRARGASGVRAPPSNWVQV